VAAAPAPRFRERGCNGAGRRRDNTIKATSGSYEKS
jgi:hypothetical protein